MAYPTPKKPLVIGLTGGIGSGKTLVAQHLAKRGATIIDADEIAHQLTQANGLAMPAIVQHFGTEAQSHDGSMNRTHIRDLIFEHPEQRQKLENILHPMIEQHIERALATPIQHYAVLVIPLLIENKRWQNRLERIVVVDCTIEQQESRVQQRNQWPTQQIKNIIATQASRETRLSKADHVLDNSQDLGYLIHQIEQLHTQLLKIVPK